GRIGAGIEFGNHSPTACAIQGTPGVELLTSGGQPIRLPVRPCSAAVSLIVPCWPPTMVRLLPNAGQPQPHQPNPGWGALFLFWQEYGVDGPCSAPPPDPAVTVRLTMPATGDRIEVSVPTGGNTSEAAALANATCGGGLVVYPFQAD